MARMYARRKGKSGSKKPYRKEIPEWVNMTPQEVEEMVVQLYNQGYSTSMIGMIMRDKYGIPSIRLLTGKKVSKILEDHGITIKVPEDLENLIIKALRLRKHLANNKKDLHKRRALSMIESKIRRLVNYNRREGILPEDWTYKPETAEMLISR